MNEEHAEKELWLCARAQGFTHDYRTNQGYLFRDMMGLDYCILLEEIAEEISK